MAVEAEQPAALGLDQARRHGEIRRHAGHQKGLVPLGAPLQDHLLDVFPAAREVGLLAEDVQNSHARAASTNAPEWPSRPRSPAAPIGHLDLKSVN
jgi:hypothetical protein